LFKNSSSGQTQLFNLGIIEAVNRTAGQAQVKLRLLQSITLKIPPLGDESKKRAEGGYKENEFL
jgi:hypothetical protein